MTRAHTFIKAAEIWKPGDDGQLLEFSAGTFGQAHAFAALSRSMYFGRGEGLPGRTWEEGQPVLLPSFDPEHFRRTAAANAAGFTGAVSMPFFDSGALKAVLVLFCGHLPQRGGAIELWRADSADASELKLADGTYGEKGEAFAKVSRDMTFARGEGLPGLAWRDGTACFLEDIGAATQQQFARHEAAAASGLTRGLAIPGTSASHTAFVVTVLADAALPLARRIERWTMDPATTSLRCVYALSESDEELAPSETLVDEGMDCIEQAWKSGAPAIMDKPGALIAIPVRIADKSREIVVLHL